MKKFHQIDLVTLNFPVYRGIPPTLLLIFFFLRCALWSKKYLKPEFKPNETNLKIVKKSSKKYLKRSSKNRQTNCKKNRQKNVKKISEKFRQIDLVTLNFQSAVGYLRLYFWLFFLYMAWSTYFKTFWVSEFNDLLILHGTYLNKRKSTFDLIFWWLITRQGN